MVNLMGYLTLSPDSMTAGVPKAEEVTKTSALLRGDKTGTIVKVVPVFSTRASMFRNRSRPLRNGDVENGDIQVET